MSPLKYTCESKELEKYYLFALTSKLKYLCTNIFKIIPLLEDFQFFLREKRSTLWNIYVTITCTYVKAFVEYVCIQKKMG